MTRRIINGMAIMVVALLLLVMAGSASAATVAVNSTTYISGAVANATISDSAANTANNSVQSFALSVTSTSDPTGLTLTFTEAGNNSSTFTSGAFTFGTSSAGIVLEVADGDTIYLNYTNASANATASFDARATTLAIETTTYGDLTDKDGVAVTPTFMVAGVPTIFTINATDDVGILDTGFTGAVVYNNDGSATSTSASFVSADNGTKNFTVTDNVNESVTIYFNSTSTTGNVTTSQAVYPNKPAKLRFPSAMAVSTLTDALKVSIEVTDAYDNLIPAATFNTGTTDTITTNATQLGGTDGLGNNVVLTVSFGVEGINDASGNVSSATINTSTVGKMVVLFSDTTDETVSIRASKSFLADATTDISFLPAVGFILIDTNKTTNEVNANGGVNGLGDINITAQLMSAAGVPLNVPGSVISFTSSNLSVLDIVGLTATTDANGIATLTKSSTTTAGTTLVTATVSSGVGVGKLAYDSVDASHLGIDITTLPVVRAASSTLVVANARAGDDVTVTASLVDYAGIALPAGVTVTFNITAGDALSTLDGVAIGTPVTADTNSTGVATVVFRSTNATVAGITNTINASAIDELGVAQRVGATEQNTVIKTNDAAVLVVTPANKGLPNVIGRNETFTVVTYDNFGNVNETVGNIIVNVSTSNTVLGNMTVAPAAAVNNYATITTANGAGSVLYTVNSTAVGSATLTFAAYTNESGQASGLVNNITTTVPVTTSGASGVTITADAGAAVGTNVLLTINLTDASGTLIGVDDTNMNLISSAGSTSLNVSSLTSVNGQAFANLSVSSAGSVTVTVYVAGLTSDSTAVLFSGNATTFTITPAGSVAVNETMNLSVQAYDGLGNPAVIYNGAAITGESIVIPSVSGLTFGATTLTFDATGNAVGNVTSATTGTYTVEMVALGTTATSDVTFTAAAAPATLDSIAVGGSATVANGSNATYTATATYSDATTAVITAAWTSSNTTVATIDAATGELTALALGTTTVNATSEGVTGTKNVTVSETGAGVIGDINGDGSVTSVDALMVLQMTVGNLAETTPADVNGDGSVTSVDALMILQAVVGNITL